VPVDSCNLWIQPDSICCTPTPPSNCPAPANLCPQPAIEDLIWYAQTLITTVTGIGYPGWCRKLDRVCRVGAGCGACTGLCSKCCTVDEVPVGDGVWPVTGPIVVRRGSPDGPVIPAALYWLTGYGTLAHQSQAGWPTCEPLFIEYQLAGVPHWGPTTVARLVCELRKLWTPAAPCDVILTADQVAASDVAAAMSDPWVIDILGSVKARVTELGAGPRTAGHVGSAASWSRISVGV
jgi:hypothetical protein